MSDNSIIIAVVALAINAKGYKRLGCVGCPMSTHRAEELEKYPKFKQAYIRAFDRMLKDMEDATWGTGDDVYQWWIKE